MKLASTTGVNKGFTGFAMDIGTNRTVKVLAEVEDCGSEYISGVYLVESVNLLETYQQYGSLLMMYENGA